MTGYGEGIARQGTVGLDESRPLLVVGLVLFFAYFLTVLYVQHWHTAVESQNYAAEGRPLLRNLDGYSYLRHARDIGKGTYSRHDALRGAARPYPPPLLSGITAWTSMLTGQPLESVAYILPVCLSFLMGVALMHAGWLIGNLWTGLVAMFAAFAAGFWTSRAGPGFYDTDCLNPTLVLSVCLFLYSFLKNDGRERLLPLGLLVLTLCVLAVWWQLWPVVLALCFCTYALTLPVRASGFERGIKLTLGTGILACVGFLALYAAGIVSTGPAMFVSFVDHLRLSMGAETGTFADMGRAVQQLSVFLPDAGKDVFAGWGAVGLALAGLCLLAFRRPLFAVSLVPCVVLGAGSFFSARYYIFATPVLALGYAYFAVSAARLFRMPLFAPVSGLKEALFALGFVAFLAPGMVAVATKDIPPAVPAGDAILAQSLPAKVPEDAVVWCWWDTGYQVQYHSGLATVSDGGRLEPERMFAVAYALAATDAAMAARWMRFFVVRGELGVRRLESWAGGREELYRLVEQVFSSPSRLRETLARYGVSADERTREFLFPKTAPEIVLFIHGGILDDAFWWERFGRSSLLLRTEDRRLIVDRIPLADVGIERKSGVVELPERGEARISALVDVSSNGVNLTEYPQSGPVCVVHHDKGVVYSIDPVLFDSVALRLLYRPETLDGVFEPLEAQLGQRGAWRIAGMHAVRDRDF